MAARQQLRGSSAAGGIVLGALLVRVNAGKQEEPNKKLFSASIVWGKNCPEVR